MHTRHALALCALLASSASFAQQSPNAPAQPNAPARGRACGVAGLWRSAQSWVTDFSSDGRWQTYTAASDARRATPAIQGSYDVQGTLMNFRVLEQRNTFRYRVTLTGNACESMRLVLLGDDLQTYPPGFTIEFTRVPETQ